MTRRTPAPRHLWIIGVVTLLWNLMGAYDYLMTKTHNAAYMAKFEQAQLDYFYGFPLWFTVFWAIAVWASVAGSALLLLRRRVAEPVLLASLVSMVVTAVYSYGLSNGREVMGATGMVFTLVIFVVALGLWLYARALKARNVLV